MPKKIHDSAVYNATIDAVLAHGYAGATMKLIAASAEVSELTLFRKYKSKSQLIAAAVAKTLVHPLANQDLRPSGDVAADLRALVESFSQASGARSRLFAMIMADMARYPELRSTLQVPNELMLRAAELIAHYQRVGQLRDGEPLLLVGSLVGPIIVNSMLRHGNPDLNPPRIDLDHHVDRFLQGNLAPTGGE